jgi:chemotaxis protein histidine kinase CheA
MSGAVKVEDVGAGVSRHRVITPPNPLRAKIRLLPATAGDPVARAEAALKELSNQFDSWLDEDINLLCAARSRLAEEGLSEGVRDILFRAAHNLKGTAGTLDFPLVAAVGASLCELLETVAPDKVPATLVTQHVETMRAMVAGSARGEGSAIARTLSERLRDVTRDYIGQMVAAGHSIAPAPGA